ncbi:hypothetical protein [Geofilum rhodophaeum]|uniref:hypothetical protein n=1 Tax=Geofilum rhodophaeum TaxID=1965019 RepID=UPI000B5200A7|nr:hypothetical protein [Geofilum rhodophaeum]
MKNYRVRVRDEKTAFFEELMRYLDFCDYESVEGFAEPRIYPGFEFKEKEKSTKKGAKGRPVKEAGIADLESNMASLREVMSRIDAQRDKNRK